MRFSGSTPSLQHSHDFRKHILQVRGNILVREPEDFHAVAFQELRAKSIFPAAAPVDGAVHPNRQLTFSAVEVEDETAKSMLSAEPEPFEPRSSQSLP